MMCMTELHGGVCHRTSTPHKSGNKMKEKKKKSIRPREPADPRRGAHTRRSQRKVQAHGSATVLIRRPNSVIAMSESFNIERGVLYCRET